MSEVETRIHIDRADKTVTFERWQDVEPIIDNNKILRTIEQRSDWGRHVATIPNVVLEQWLHEEMNRGNVHITLSSPEFDAIIARKIKDPDWAHLRTDK